MKMWACGVSFQSMRVLAKVEVSRAEEGRLASEFENGKPWNGSQTSNEKGSKSLLRRRRKKLGMSDMAGEVLVCEKRVERNMSYCLVLMIGAIKGR